MDQDGANTKYLTLGNELVLTPRFNPTNQMVTYMSFFRNLPRVYLLDIETGVLEVVGVFPGMTFAPRFSPDGKKIIFTNGPRKHAINVTQRIGIDQYFDDIFDIIDSNFVPKHAIEPYKK